MKARLEKMKAAMKKSNPNFRGRSQLKKTWTAREICEAIGEKESKFVSSNLHRFESHFVKLARKRQCAVTGNEATIYRLRVQKKKTKKKTVQPVASSPVIQVTAPVDVAPVDAPAAPVDVAPVDAPAAPVAPANDIADAI